MRIRFAFAAATSVCLVQAAIVGAQGIAQQNIQIPGVNQKEALKVHDQIYQATGFGNTYLITTSEGNVVIDTSGTPFAAMHRTLLQKVSKDPVKYIILTHAHPDHMGGIAAWKEKGTQVIAHEAYGPHRAYQRRLAGLFTRRNAAQYGIAPFLVERSANSYLGPGFEADTTFRDTHVFKLGNLTFELHHTPGETQDQLAVWIPELKAAFIGDNMYETFPNMYTLRGTEFRAPIPWMESLERVLSWEPEFLLGSHLPPIQGREEIQKRLTHYRDAIKYIHDATLAGMNEGKDVYTLMQETKLPPELAIGEQYGRLTWSIRGIYEGYVGWFDENPANMYAIPRSAIDADLVELAGADKIVERARDHYQAGRLVESLHLLDAVVHVQPDNAVARKLRVECYEGLRSRSVNVIETGWLRDAIRREEASIKRASAGNGS